MGHGPIPLNYGAFIFMGSVLTTYLFIKLPLKYKWAAENRTSPKADLAWRQSAEKWLEGR